MMGEFVWQLGRHRGVISLFWQIDAGVYQFRDEVMYARGTWQMQFNVFNEVKFEHQYHYRKSFMLADFARHMLADFARHLLSEFYKVVEQRDANEELTNGKMSDTDLFERCRKFLTEHNWLIYIDDEEMTPADWDLIRKHLLCESTKGCIVVITTNPSVAKQCVDYQQHRALNIDDLRDKDSDGVGSQQVKEVGLFVGRKREMRSMTLSAGLNSFAVWGIAGVGKSALVREYYNHIKSSQTYLKHGWADVPNPFNLMSLCRRLLLDFFSADVDGKETAALAMMEGQDPIQECSKILRQNECFLVIDGLQSTHDWDLIKAALLSQARNDGLTFVITREESIARHCTISEKHIYSMNGLVADQALDLFKKITLDGKELCEFPHEAVATSELIMSKCGGIPQVIIAIGKAARTYHMKIGHFESVNTRFMGILVDASLQSSNLRGLFCWMQSYFEACSDELKPCIYYLSVFSAGESIVWKRLIRRWMAEGYLSGCGATAEEKGDKLVFELWKLSILYFDPQTSRLNLKANGFFREYIKSQPLEDYLVFELEGSSSPSSRLTGQHLTISRSWDRDEVVFQSIDMSRLRSLTVFGKWMPFLISNKMKVLRVLDLEGTSSTLESDGTGVVTDEDLEMIGKQFPRLKFLSLRGCKHITCLPDSLGAMKQLETLNIRHTSIVELPPAVISRLQKLHYIRVGTTEARQLQQAAAVAVAEAAAAEVAAAEAVAAAEVAAAEAAAPTPPSSPPPTTQEDVVPSGTSPLLVGTKAAALRVAQRASTRITGAWKRREDALVESHSSSSWWESKKQRRRRVRVAANGGGVEVGRAAAEGIGKLTELHTLGVVNIAGAKGGLLLLKELKKLTQLRKLGLSGINRKNWKDLTLAISGHLRHLESLSLQLMLLEKDGNYEFACFKDISLEPKTLKRLKVSYNSTGGGAGASPASISAAWIKQFPNLERFNHEVRISSQDDMDSLGFRWSETGSYFENGLQVLGFDHRLGIKPIDQHLNTGKHWLDLDSLVVYCSGIISEVTFGYLRVTAVRIHCCRSCGGSSCLRIDGLENICFLKEVFVTGPCSDGFKEQLQKQLDKHEGKPALRLL